MSQSSTDILIEINQQIIKFQNPPVVRKYSKADHQYEQLRSWLLGYFRHVATQGIGLGERAITGVGYLIQDGPIEVTVSWRTLDIGAENYSLQAVVLLRIYEPSEGEVSETFMPDKGDTIVKLILSMLKLPQDGKVTKNFPIMGSKPKEEEEN